MIVSCPACRTRYRYSEPVPESGGQAVCGKCEQVVPLVAERRSYVLRAQVAAVPAGVPVPVPVGAGIGMDGPALAPTSPSTGGAGGAGVQESATPYGPVGSDPDPSASPFDQPVEISDSPFDAPLAVDVDRPIKGSTSVADEAVAASKPKRAQAAKGAGKRGGAGRRVVELLVIVVLAAAGAAAAEYATMQGWLYPLRVHAAVEPVRPGIVGGLLGVLVAWIGVRWAARRP
jgi:hypothetical protein